MISPMVRWAIAFADCVALVMLSVVFIDRPVAIFFRDLELPERRIGLVLDTLLLLPALGAAALCMAAFRTWRGIAVPSWVALFSRAGLGCLCAFAINDFALKPLFGRYTVGQFMTFPHPYGFVPFGGNLLSGFPSGHAALVVGFLGICWMAKPHLRSVWCSIIAVVLLALLAAGWHFVSDELAGVFVGAASAYAIAAVWDRQAVPHR